MSATIKDVAKLAGVSISTVSRVINNSKPVSPEVRRKVLDAIEKLDYQPNEVARSLVTRRSNLIGVIVTDIGNYYIAETVRGIEEIGRMYKYDIILSSSYGSIDAEKKFIQFLMSKQVDGIILITEKNDNQVIEIINEFNIPYVYLNRYYAHSNLNSVFIDHYNASRSMTKYLLDLGHRNILYVTYCENEEYSIEKYKVDGYNKAIEENNAGRGFLFRANGVKIKDGYEIGDSVFDIVRKNNITAIFCGQDELAIGLMNYCYDNEIRIPDDISISGFGDINIASIYRPKLTTVRVPYYDIGAVSIRNVIKKIDGEDTLKENIFLPIQIMMRESCAKIR